MFHLCVSVCESLCVSMGVCESGCVFVCGCVALRYLDSSVDSECMIFCGESVCVFKAV